MVTLETFLLLAAIYGAPNLRPKMRAAMCALCLLIAVLMWTFKPL